MLKLYNTLTRNKDTFKPISSKEVGLYTCGPTVYWHQHIGNLRTYVFSDILKRTLQYNNNKVKHIINVTDVGHLTSDADTGEDKMELAAKREGKSAKDVADFYLKLFKQDFDKLNILPPSKWVKATEHIKEQINLVEKLEKKKYTYETNDGIYFDSTKFKQYGKLAKLKIKGLQKGKRTDIREKKNATDFALWKFSDTPGQRVQEWESPWGTGFPGWHLECSAMSMKYLGDKFDIHTGGEDHISIHHTNEIAQSEAATGKKPFVKYWLHGAFLVHKGEKVSKSKGGLYTIFELEELGYKPMHFRYLCLLTHYRKPLDFTLEHLDAAKNAYEKLKRKVIEVKGQNHKGNTPQPSFQKNFLNAINDDLNMPKAIQIVLELLDDFDIDPKKKLALLENFDKVLGLDIKDMKKEKLSLSPEIKKLIEKREHLRNLKQFAEADIIREKIKEKGFVLEDSADGVKVHST
jgi:cysteinyl-tRNA synthetase